MNDNSEIQDPYEGQKFSSFEVLKKYLEEYGKASYFKFWVRSSHTITSSKAKISKKLNPDLRYLCMKFACIFGGEKIRYRGSGIRKSSTIRNLGCPCMINAVVGEDGNHVKLDTVILEHNHALCQSMYDSISNSRKRVTGSSNDSQNSILVKNITNNAINEGTVVMQDVTNLEKDMKIENQDLMNCDIKNIQEKYGDTVKIIVVDSAEEAVEMLDSNKSIIYSNSGEENFSVMEKNICRLCLSSEGKLSPIFNPNSPLESTILSFKIMGCASIEVSSDDDLPKNICSTCEATLDIAYNFRLTCEKSDSILREACCANSNFMDADNQGMTSNDLEEETFQKYNNQDSLGALTEESNLKNNCTLDDNSTFSCPVCNSDFDSLTLMLNHLKAHSDQNAMIYACNKCNLMCSSVENLYEHMSEHLNDTWNEECSDCDLNFLNQCDLKNHEQESASTDNQSEKNAKSEKNYLCNVCGKILRTKDRFQCHKNTHEGLRPHVCSECGKGFADRKNMHQHFDIVHLRKAKHECPVCQKKFYTPTKMKSHITMHYGVKPFTCDVCGKTFRLKMNMIKHKKTHSNDRPHQCDKCNAAFIDKNMLKRHSYIHGGIRPYPCPICGHRFSVKFHLKKHLEKSKCHGNNEYTTDEWLGMSQDSSSNKLQNNEGWVVVYEANEEDLLNGTENEPMNIGILEELNDVEVKDET